ncbi:M24 family metallopeptidase [Halalkalibacillus halophilus]|uniref:M24 family metallopeptidase n=1 Tax=Halalkalibacillus halophilus TaxID=392827 RepID=UPI000420603B|nr:Xaa-Pro peptidase family protein [Halalkalibacillus halophilus]
MYETQKEKMEQAVRYLIKENIDTWLIYTSEGSDPCLPLVTGVKTVGPGAFLFRKSGEKIAITSSIDAQDVRESKLFDQVLTYQNGLAEELVPLIEKWKPLTIAVNKSKNEHLADGLTAGRFMWLKRTLSEVFEGTYLDAEPFLNKLRSIKTEAEIEKIKIAIDITHDIYESVFKEIQAGMTEKEMGQLFVEALEERSLVNGIDRTLSMPIVMKDNIAHRGPSDRVVEKGELVIFDFSVDCDGYVSDIARTVYFLKDNETQAPEPIQQTFDTIHEAITLAAERIKPGIKGYEVDQAAREHLLTNGYPEIEHATGHQIGQDVHDGGALLGPKWKRYGESPYELLEKGNVFTIEPTVFLREKGIHFIVEENVVITNEGITYLSKRQDELILID